MKVATHCLAAFAVALTLVSSAFGLGNGPNYDPTKTMLFPAGSKSQGLYSTLNNSGEFGVSGRAQKKKGKLKRVRDVELTVPGRAGLSRLSSAAEGSLVKVSATDLKETMNMIPSADGLSMQVFVRNKKGKVISNMAEVSIAGRSWFETFGKIKSAESQLKTVGKISPVYSGSFAQQPRGTVSGYVELESGILSSINEVTLAQLKALVMAYQAFLDASSGFGLEDGTSILDTFGGFSAIARGLLAPLLTDDLSSLQALADQLLSTDPAVAGFTAETLTSLIETVLSGGKVDWDALVIAIQELVDIPVKPLTEDFQFIVEYSWPPEVRDLDTGTTFLGATVGYSYSPSGPYMNWTGDNTTTGGQEIVAIDINGAAAAGALPSSFQITCKAGWYQPNGGSGPATLHMYLLNQRTGARFGEVTSTINPGTQTGPATTPVGSASFTYAADTKILSFAID